MTRFTHGLPLARVAVAKDSAPIASWSHLSSVSWAYGAMGAVRRLAVRDAVGIFARWRGSCGGLRPGAELTEESRVALPPHFEAVGEALAAGHRAVEACWVAGRTQAELGYSLGECLEGLRAATQHVAGRDPVFAETHALALAWSESVLGYLHGLSCADPLTGLSTHAHIRERIGELYRDAVADGVAHSHALVITEAGGLADPLSAARRLTLVGQAARSVFSGTETIGQVGASRVIVVAPRNDLLPTRVSLLRRMLTEQADRVWIEGLPDTDASAVHLLDELARG
jgi:hypothetical protein